MISVLVKHRESDCAKSVRIDPSSESLSLEPEAGVAVKYFSQISRSFAFDMNDQVSSQYSLFRREDGLVWPGGTYVAMHACLDEGMAGVL